jgi:transposase-like protein
MNYTTDFKRRAVARLANGARLCDVSNAAGVPKATLLRWRAEQRQRMESQVTMSRKESINLKTGE